MDIFRKPGMNIIELVGRDAPLFRSDIEDHDGRLAEAVSDGRFLVIGGAGSIGQAVSREIFKRYPRKLHIVDLSENNTVELVRDLRSTLGYIKGDFQTFAIDCHSPEFDAFFAAEGPYDYVLNLSALKHVRSEKDPYTLMRMLRVNIFNTLRTLALARNTGATKYFCVSTDKAANPANMMGASKRIMEMFLMRESLTQNLSMARFANVAFSDGSLLHGFNQRFAKRQPLSAPDDVRRYFLTPQESGELCLMSCLLAANREILFPKLSEDLHLITFAEIATRYLAQLGYEPHLCTTEDEARSLCATLIPQKKWPCLFFKTDTTGEKNFEEFFTEEEDLDMQRFQSVGVIRNPAVFDARRLDTFSQAVAHLQQQGHWTKQDIVELFFDMLPAFSHQETGRYLDQKM